MASRRLLRLSRSSAAMGRLTKAEMRSATTRSRVRTRLGNLCDEGCAEFWLTIAAVLQKEHHELPDCLEFDPIDHGAALALDRDEPGSCQCGEMIGHRVVRHIQAAGDFACRKTLWLLPHQKAERREAGGLSEGGQRLDGEIWFHMSRIIDVICDGQLTACPRVGHRIVVIVEQALPAIAPIARSANVLMAFSPVVAILIGAVTALSRRHGEALPPAIQHFAAGVVLAAAATEILPQANHESATVRTVIDGILGVATVQAIQKLEGRWTGSARMVSAIGIDLFVNGVRRQIERDPWRMV